MIIERNYRTNPHTADFLMTFHTAGGTNLGGAVAIADAPAEDLLDSVPVEAPAYRLTERQVAFISDLIREIHELDADLGSQAGTYTAGMTEHGKWTREKVSTWIERLIAKRAELRAAASKATAPVQVADGRYAVEENGELHFFKVTNGRKAGFVFLDIQASDDWHSIRNVTRIRSVLALIAADPKAAMVRYGKELGQCGRCGRTLTDPNSRAKGIGPDCEGQA